MSDVRPRGVGLAELGVAACAILVLSGTAGQVLVLRERTGLEHERERWRAGASQRDEVDGRWQALRTAHQAEIAALSSELDALKAGAAPERARADALRSEIGQATRTLAGLREQADEAREAQQEAMALRMKLAAEATALEGQLKELRDNNAAAAARQKAHATTKAGLDKELEGLRAALAQRTDELEATRQASARAEEQRRATTRELELAQTKLAEQTQRTQVARTEELRVRSDIEQLGRTKLFLEATVASLSSSAANMVRAQREETAELERRKAGLEAELKRLTQERTQSQLEADRVKRALEEAQARLAEVVVSRDKAREEQRAAQAERDRLVAEAARLRTELETAVKPAEEPQPAGEGR